MNWLRKQKLNRLLRALALLFLGIGPMRSTLAQPNLEALVEQSTFIFQGAVTKVNAGTNLLARKIC